MADQQQNPQMEHFGNIKKKEETIASKGHAIIQNTGVVKLSLQFYIYLFSDNNHRLVSNAQGLI